MEMKEKLKHHESKHNIVANVNKKLFLQKKELELQIKSLKSEHQLTLPHKTTAHEELRNAHSAATTRLEELEKEHMDLKAKQKKEGEEMEALKQNLEQNAKKGSGCMKFEMHVQKYSCWCAWPCTLAFTTATICWTMCSATSPT